MDNNWNRRDFMVMSIAGISSGMISAMSFPVISSASEKESKENNKEVSPAEDLMREHGVLRRILLIYEEILHQSIVGRPYAPVHLQKSARIIKSFIEGYHEKLEEDMIFPQFEKEKKQLELVKTLRLQHQAGRNLTDTILKNAKGNSLQGSLSSFIHMYRPHAAREDTFLLPEFRRLISEKEYKELGDRFEDREHVLFGKTGFSDIVSEVAGIEKALGIYELSKFTP